MKITPSSTFLFGLAQEYETSTYGPYTRETVKDWIGQNEQ